MTKDAKQGMAWYRQPAWPIRTTPTAGLILSCGKGARMLKKRSDKQEPQKDLKGKDTHKFYELAGLYTLSFHRKEKKPDWFYDRIAELERELGGETAKAALDYASENESFYSRLMH